MTHSAFLKPSRGGRGVALLLACALACGAAFAEKPDGAGGKGDKGNKGHNGHKSEMHDDRGQGSKKAYENKSGGDDRVSDVRVGGYFGSNQRVVLQDYYGPQFKAGKCPPGLAKKNNGCMPPGQAKKYNVGRRLPSDVVYYPVPQSLVTRLGAPPAGHKYVRVAADILLLAIGTNMVIDAVTNLSSL